MKIAIIGFGVEGRAAYDYWVDGNEITICDQKTDLEVPSGVATKLGSDYLSGLDEFDIIVRSPFVRPDAIVIANSPTTLDKVTSNTNEFLRVCPTKNVIGITGTKGKGTTSTLVAKMLEAAGKRVHLGGNIGLAALNLLNADIQPEDWVVLELSSYQLLDLEMSPHIAACLMVVPEHLDWHIDINEYIGAKKQLFTHQTSEDIAVYYAANQNSSVIAGVSPGNKIPYMQSPGAVVEDGNIKIDGQTICAASELKLVGEHNWQNACAATTIVWQVAKSVDAIRQTLTSFSGLPFRIELRRNVDGVSYYNDSFATGPGACLAALRAIKQPKVMILGGFDRGLELVELADELINQGDQLRHALLIGDSKQRLAEVLVSRGFTNYTITDASTMPEIVAEAKSFTQSGDAVVLSPGFASFGLFENFEDRGRKFNAAVEAL